MSLFRRIFNRNNTPTSFAPVVPIGNPAPIGAASSGGVFTPQSIGNSIYDGGEQSLYDAFGGEQVPQDAYNNFMGIAIGKKGNVKKETRIAARKENKNNRLSLRTDRKKARTENLRSKSSSRLTLAEQGIAQQSDFGQGLASVSAAANIAAKFIPGVGGAAGGQEPVYSPSIGGGIAYPDETIGSQQTQQQMNTVAGAGAGVRMPTMEDYNNPQKEKNKNMPFIIAGVVVVLLVIVLLIKKK